MNTHRIRFTLFSTTIACLSLLAAPPVTAQSGNFSTGFDSLADLENNFTMGKASNVADVVFDSYTLASGDKNTTLRKTKTGYQAALLNDLTFGDVSISTDVRFSAAGPSMGLYSRVGSDGYGYAALVDLKSTGEVQFRIFDSNSSVTNSGVGTSLYAATLTPKTGTSVNFSTFYTFTFTTRTTTNNNVELILTLSTTGANSTIIATSGKIIDTSSPLLTAGEVGFRAAGTIIYIDNFSANAIAVPEPATTAMIFSAAAFAILGIIRLRRARR